MERINVYLCIACWKFSEVPGNCTFCKMPIPTAPIPVEIAILNRLTEISSKLDDLIEKA